MNCKGLQSSSRLICTSYLTYDSLDMTDLFETYVTSIYFNFKGYHVHLRCKYIFIFL